MPSRDTAASLAGADIMDHHRLRLLIALTILSASLSLHADDKPKKSEKPAAEQMEKKDEKPSATTTTPTTTPSKHTPQLTQNKPAASITQAITTLSQEFKSNKPREKSDYFGKTPPSDITPEAVLQALERPVPGGAQLEAYVKWQLLSGVPGKFSEDLVKRALAVYRRAPYPAEHPGLDRRTLDRTVGGMQKSEMPAANKEFSALIERVNQANAPILGYRAALFERLPNQYESFQAALADLELRVSHGLKSDRFFDTVAAGIRSWAINAKAGQLNTIGNNLIDLKAATDHKSAKPYTQIFEDKGVKWKTDTPIDPKKLDALIAFLEQAAQSPAGGLKFKDDKK
jgi:hypothetical protein